MNNDFDTVGWFRPTTPFSLFLTFTRIRARLLPYAYVRAAHITVCNRLNVFAEKTTTTTTMENAVHVCACVCKICITYNIVASST